MTDGPTRLAWLATSAAAVLVLLVYAPALEAPFLVPKFAALELTAAVAFAAFAVRRPRWSPLVLLGAALVLGTTLVSWLAATGRAEGAPYAVDAMARWAALFGLACGASVVEDAPDARSGVLEAITVAAGVVAALGLVQHVGLLPRALALPVISLPGSTFGNRNLAAEVMAMALPFGVAAVLAERKSEGEAPDARVAVGIATLLELLFLAVTRARGAWLGGACGVGVAVWILRPRGARRPTRMAALVLGGALLAGVAASVPGRWSAHDAGDAKRYEQVGLLFEATVDVQSTALRTRLGFWRRAARMIGDHPWLGVGPGNWPVVFPRYAEPNATRDRVLSMTVAPRQAHDDLVERTTETGVVGLAALLFLAVAVVRALRARLARTDADLVVTAGAAGALAALAGLSVTGFPLEMPGTIALTALALGFVAAEPQAKPPSPASPRVAWVLVAAAAVLVLGASVRAERRVRASRWLGVAERALRRDHGPLGAEQALAALGQSLDAAPGAFTAELRTAQMDIREKHGADAVAAARASLAVEPYSVNAWATLADAYLTAGASDEARDAATQALAILPECPLALFVRIKADVTSGASGRADRDALQSLAERSEDADTRRSAAALLRELDPSATGPEGPKSQ